MKKTFSVNIAGRLFNIDEDAFQMLDDYLKRIEFGYAQSSEGREIKNDVEARFSDLFDGYKTGNTSIVSIEDVRRAIDIIGRPEDLGASRNASYHHGYSYEQREPYSTPGTKYTKRLYRDTDNRRIGGVCGGLGWYFDVDPVLIRILFVVFFFVGFGFLAYIIMWIAIPAARMPIQKIEMRGLPPTPENYQKLS